MTSVLGPPVRVGAGGDGGQIDWAVNPQGYPSCKISSFSEPDPMCPDAFQPLEYPFSGLQMGRRRVAKVPGEKMNCGGDPRGVC